MKAAVLEGLNTLVVKEVPTPRPGPGELLMRVKACAVCGSDLRIFRHGNPRVTFPQIVGHEVSGVVEERGEGVSKFAVGQRICLAADVPCGTCRWCTIGLGNNCARNYAIGYQFDGGFAEHMLVNKVTMDYGPVHAVPENLDDEEAAIAEPVACAVNGLEIVGMSAGKSIVIIGLGPIGCLMIPLARHMGATKVIAVQRSAKRMEMAKQFGADVYLASEEEDVVRRCREETGGEGPDVVITTCGSVEAHEQAIEMVAHRGWVNLFGGLGGDARNLSVPSNTIHYKECFVTGSHGSTPRHHRIALDMIAAGYVPAKQVVTHRFTLDETREAFAAVEERKGMKAVVKP
jgi:L-iditol 2-dehydrogenase